MMNDLPRYEFDRPEQVRSGRSMIEKLLRQSGLLYYKARQLHRDDGIRIKRNVIDVVIRVHKGHRENRIGIHVTRSDGFEVQIHREE